MKPIVIDTKKSDLVADLVHLPQDGALLAPAPRHVVERLHEDPIELAAPEKQIDAGRAEVVDGARRVRTAASPKARRPALGEASDAWSPEDEADEVVEDEDARRAGDDRRVDAAADPRRPARGRQAEVAARERDDEAEDEALGRPLATSPKPRRPPVRPL